MSTEIILEEEPSERGRIRINPENPVLEWRRQSRMWANRVARELGFPTNEAYIKTLPEFGPKPRSFKDIHGITAIPILVDPRIALSELLGIVGISSFFDPKEIKDWTEEGFETHKEPYATWLTYIPNTSVKEVRANLW